jgi:four helix bundle protein
MNVEKREGKKSIIQERSYAFALRVIGIYQQLCKQNEFVLSKQLLKAGTSIGANVEEATAAQSKKDFISKMAIASKEARETNYWLRLLKDAKILCCSEVEDLLHESEEIKRILTAIVKTTNSKLKIQN